MPPQGGEGRRCSAMVPRCQCPQWSGQPDSVATIAGSISPTPSTNTAYYVRLAVSPQPPGCTCSVNPLAIHRRLGPPGFRRPGRLPPCRAHRHPQMNDRHRIGTTSSPAHVTMAGVASRRTTCSRSRRNDTRPDGHDRVGAMTARVRAAVASTARRPHGGLRSVVARCSGRTLGLTASLY
jgi:hypothetical protein